MNAIKSARQRARETVTADILDEAGRQLATDGAAGLSLRSVARELGLVSSAIYRYFASRDELLTALIVAAYDQQGADVETAVAGATDDGGSHRDRWRAGARALAQWSVAHPHHHGLLYGTPVPGYVAPELTEESGTRAMRALLAVVAAAHEGGVLAAGGATEALPSELDVDLEAAAQELGFRLPPDVVARTVMAWSQLLGLLSLELFGQFRGLTDHRDQLIDHCIETTADLVGIPPT